MGELYEQIGFFDNPFSRFSAEEELSYIDEIYFEPKYFKTLYDDIRQNNSRFIFGQRGSGKTALMYKVIAKIKRENHLFILIDNFFFLSKANSSKDFQIVFVKELLKSLVTRLITNKQKLKNLNKVEKEKLAFIITHFFDTVSQQEFKKVYEFCQASKVKNFFRDIYNKFFNRLLNNLLSGGVLLCSDLITKSLGLRTNNNEHFYREYIPTLNTTDAVPNVDHFKDMVPPECMNHVFDDLIDIIKKLEYGATIIFLDKVDETSEFKGNIEMITSKLIPLVTENRLILNSNFGLVFMLWSKLKPELNIKGVRFDKIKSVDITWSDSELKSIINKRIGYFSQGKISSLDNIFEEKTVVEEILMLSDGSPRDLIILLSRIYDQQQDINSDSTFLSSLATKRGIKRFLEDYDFYAQYPPKRSAKEDIKKIIAKLKNIGKLEFPISEVASTLKIKTGAATSYVKIWKNYGIIVEIPEVAGQIKIYRVDDPKVEYIIRDRINIK